MKKIIYSATILSVLLLAACEEPTEKNVVGTVEESGTVEEDAGGTVETSAEPSAEVENEAAKDAPHEINQVISDNANAKVTLISMTEVADDTNGKVYKILFEIENKRTDTLAMGYADISANGQQLSSGQSGISYEDISPGKTGYATINIYAEKEPELPELNSLKLNLDISKKMGVGEPLQGIEEYPIDVTFEK